MLTQAELTKWRFIKAMAMTGRSAEVPRADKQWILDIAAREEDKLPFDVVKLAQAKGFEVSNVQIQL